MDEIMAYTDQTDIDFFDELQAIYTENRQIVQKEIYAFYAQYAKENKISVQEAKKKAHARRFIELSSECGEVFQAS